MRLSRRSLLLSAPAIIIPTMVNRAAYGVRPKVLDRLPAPIVSADFRGGLVSASGTLNVGPHCPQWAAARTSTATYFDNTGTMQTAASGVPRIDYNPTIPGQCSGLLTEAAATNLLLNSAALITQTVTVSNLTAYVLSFYGTGTVVLSGAATATLTGSGVYPTRSLLSFTTATTALVLTVTGTVTDAQLELGVYPTSYVPTTVAAATRAADKITVAVPNLNVGGYTFYGKFGVGGGVGTASQVIFGLATIPASNEGAMVGYNNLGHISIATRGISVNLTPYAFGPVNYGAVHRIAFSVTRATAITSQTMRAALDGVYGGVAVLAPQQFGNPGVGTPYQVWCGGVLTSGGSVIQAGGWIESIEVYNFAMSAEQLSQRTMFG